MTDLLTIYPGHAFDLGDDRILATHIPAGSWKVRVTAVPVPGDTDLYLAWAQGTGGQTGPDSFPIASGHDRSAVIRAASRWQASATATVSSDRVRYVGVDGPRLLSVSA